MNLIQRISYEQSLIEEIWRLTREIELAQQVGHMRNTDNLLCELEAKLADYVKLIKKEHLQMKP